MKLDSFTESSYSDEQFNGKTRSLEDNIPSFLLFRARCWRVFFLHLKATAEEVERQQKEAGEGKKTARGERHRRNTKPSRGD
jgi:hypothetical protein